MNNQNQLSFFSEEQIKAPILAPVFLMKNIEKKNPPQKQKNKNIHDNWRTPQYFYDKLDKEFSFDFDPCVFNEDSIKDESNGLLIDWGKRNFVNPPYSQKLKEAFIKKGIEESKKGKLCVFLLPVSTSTKIFHDFILPNISEPIRFLRGRLKFEGKNAKDEIVQNGSGTFDSMLVIFGEK